MIKLALPGTPGTHRALAGPTLRSLALALVWLGALALNAPPALGQKIGLQSRAFEDPQNGYRVKPPVGWQALPARPDKAQLGLLMHMEESEIGGSMMVFRLESPRTSGKSSSRPDIGKVLESPNLEFPGFKSRRLIEDEQVEWKKRSIDHRTWEVEKSYSWVDTWTFRLEEYDICLIYAVSRTEKRKNSWLKLYEKSAKTFEPMERSGTTKPGPDADYEDFLAWYEIEVQRTPGWRALPTPSKKFVIKTSSDDDRFIKEVIKRLETARERFEEDFPVGSDFKDVSVVRICGSPEEFHRYGNTRPGVAGWFNPGSTELVLYDAQEIDRNQSYAVMIHEGFHQYCHFIFGQSEAHRWFDEGHGDYYGGMTFRSGKTQITARMPGGLNRLDGAKEMVRNDSFVPLEKHLNFDHPSWQSRGLASYEQSWSIVYMLRQGALGKVNGSAWEDEYGDIIPNYVSALRAGYEQAYEDLRKSVFEETKEYGREPTEEELQFTRQDISPGRRDRIWKEAMEASWGDIDLDEFEAHWKLYVKKYLKG